MLTQLYIENIAVIERADVSFDRGFNVLTGETGAGKSMVIDAINAVLGERIGRDIVRSGTPAAVVSAVFDRLPKTVTDKLDELGYPPEEDGTLLIRRQIGADGRGSCHINGRVATVSLLREIGRLLVNIHGQHENQSLLSPDKHLEYLDRMGELGQQREQYVALYRKYCAVYKELRSLDTDEEQKQRRLELLQYQLKEIEDAALVAGEETALEEKRRLFRHSEKITEGLRAAQQLLRGEDDTDGGLTLVSRAVRELGAGGRVSDEVLQLSQRLETALFELEACADAVDDTAEELAFNEEERDRVEQRSELIRKLTSKYGADTAAVLAYAEKARAEFNTIENADERRMELETELDRLGKEVVAAAETLTALRKAAGEVFARQVAEELRSLDMPGVKLAVAIEPISLNATGGDKVEFRISANPGEEPKSIAKIASGGELSRIMLAMKSVMADADEIDTLIFDEIDAGISGHAAQQVGLKLWETARSTEKRQRQVLCVTHLAQIAAKGDRHLLIRKAVRDGRTFTEVTPLDRDAREQELARIIGGRVSEANLVAAGEMLDWTES